MQANLPQSSEQGNTEEVNIPKNNNKLLLIFVVLFAIFGIPGGIFVNRYIKARNADKDLQNFNQINNMETKSCSCLDPYNFGKKINAYAEVNIDCTQACKKQGFSCPADGCSEAVEEIIDGCREVCNEECKRADNCFGVGNQLGHCGWTKTKPIMEKKWCRVCETVCPTPEVLLDQEIQENIPGDQIGE